MVFSVARQRSVVDARALGDLSVVRINAPVSSAGKTVAPGHHVGQVQRLDRKPGNLADEIGRLRRRNEHNRALAVAATFDPGRLVLVQHFSDTFRRAGAGNRLHPDRAAEHVRGGDPPVVHLNAELRAQVGHGGGGSPNHK